MSLLRIKSVILAGSLAGSLALAGYDLLAQGHKALGIISWAAGLLTLVFTVEYWSAGHGTRWFLSGFVNGLAAFLVCVALFVTLGYLFTRLEVLDSPGATTSIDIVGIGEMVLVAALILAGLVMILRGFAWLSRDRNAA